jgi:EF hand
MRLFLIGLGIVLSLVFFFAVILPAARQAEKVPLLTTLTRPTEAWKFDVDAFILRWDANRDGTINLDELRKSVGNRLEGLVEKLFGAFDKNQDGRLNRAELNNLARESFFWLFEAPPMPES